MTQRVVRSLGVALNSSGRYPFRPPDFEVDHLVIGGGVVGLAIARSLALNRPDASTYLVERNNRAGEETSSRNSEVIHGGFYYPVNSLKTRLCLRGRNLMYEYCESHSVPYKKTGKLVVGLPHQRKYLEDLHRKAQSLQWPHSYGNFSSTRESGNVVPVKLLDGDEARELEPDLSKDITCALLSKETGIVDSHTLMESLERDISESESGSVVCGTSAVRVDPAENGWVVQLSTDPQGSETGEPAQTDSVLAKTIINSTGLSGPFIINALRQTLDPPAEPIPIWYARGSYAAYRGPGVTNVKHLIYPVPETGPTGHGFASLGTHLTLDLGGNIKFGPDIEWIEPDITGANSDLAVVSDEEAVDFWKAHLNPSSEQLASMFTAVRQYLPGIQESSLRPDYVGIRPKLGPPGSGFQDFVFQKDYSGKYMGGGAKEDEGGVMLTLLGIESPGLTSALAIAEMIEKDLI